MDKFKPGFHPDNPRDISEFLQLVGELWMEKFGGRDKARFAITEMAKTKDGRKLLHNCHLVVSRQITQVKEPEIHNMFLEFQHNMGVLGRGGK